MEMTMIRSFRLTLAGLSILAAATIVASDNAHGVPVQNEALQEHPQVSRSRLSTLL
jgi:hypothetical protein